MNLRNLSIKAKLLAAFAALSFIVIGVSVLAVNSLGREHAAFAGYVDGTAARLTLANAILDAANARAVGARNLVLVTANADIEVEKAAVTQAHGNVQKLIGQLKSAVDTMPAVTPRERELFTALQEVESRYGPVALDIVQKALDNNHDAAVAKMNAECRPLLAALIKAANAYIDHGAQSAKAEERAADQAFAQNRYTLIGAAVAAAALAVALAVLITKAIVSPILRAVQVARTVAAGDLSSHIDDAGKDETAQLLAALKAMNSNLVDIVSNVRQGSESIATGCAQIATGNADLSSRTEEQASSLQQTAASMEQMNTTVRHNSESSQEATRLATLASAAAQKGGEIVGAVVTTMDNITASSRKIGDIIGVIDGIAFQTNILALNAAVEAARAGEQGRGFAVVASEVRSLAQRSAEAAKEIKTLVGASVDKVEAGSRLVGDARASMEDIVGQVRRVSDLIQEIGQSANEQTEGIGQVSAAVSQLDRATQQNAALVEECAAAADSLRDQAGKLAGAVGVFKLP